MVGFITESGTLYTHDQKNKRIISDKNGIVYNYKCMSVMIGVPAMLTLEDGSVIRTSKVVRYM